MEGLRTIRRGLGSLGSYLVKGGSVAIGGGLHSIPLRPLLCPLQNLEISNCAVNLDSSVCAGLGSLQSLNISGCIFDRDFLEALPPTMTSLTLDRCKHSLKADDDLLRMVG